MQQNQPYITFYNGYKCPQIGFGTFQCNDQATLINCIKKAYENGVRHFDCAQTYNNEEYIGKALTQILEGGGKREELFITTKFIPAGGKNQSVVEELKTSLKKLNIDYVDLYLLHWPFAGIKYDKETNKVFPTHRPVYQMWAEFEICYKLGLAKNIGVSNMNVQMIIDLQSYCEVKPMMNQIELHPYLIKDGLIDCCEKFDMRVTSYASLARGGADVKKDQNFGDANNLLNDPVIKTIAQKYNKSVGQICLAFWVQQGICVIPKTENLNRIKENFEIFDFKMTDEEIKKIKSLNKYNPGIRTINPKTSDWWGYLAVFD